MRENTARPVLAKAKLASQGLKNNNSSVNGLRQPAGALQVGPVPGVHEVRVAGCFRLYPLPDTNMKVKGQAHKQACPLHAPQ